MKTTVLCLQGGLPGRTVLICPSAPALQFSDVSLGGPMRKISPRREPASHLKDDSLHSLSSPRSPRALTRTHHRFSLISTHMHGKVCHRSPFSRFSYHTHTHRSSTLKGDSEWEGEPVKRRHSWRNVSSVTVTFDGDKCESAAAQRPAGSFVPDWLPCSVLTIFR